MTELQDEGRSLLLEAPVLGCEPHSLPFALRDLPFASLEGLFEWHSLPFAPLEDLFERHFLAFEP
ncbi:MAG TPA: hypothetical protein VIJ02_03050, partial [Thermoanaerobaculia bacterium]